MIEFMIHAEVPHYVFLDKLFSEYFCLRISAGFIGKMYNQQMRSRLLIWITVFEKGLF